MCMPEYIYHHSFKWNKSLIRSDMLCVVSVGYKDKGNNVIHCTLTFYSQHPTRTHISHYSFQKEDKTPEFSQKWIIPTSDGSPVNIQALQEKQSVSISPILRGKLKTSYPGLTSCESSRESGFSFYFCLFVYYCFFIFINNLLVFFNRVKTNTNLFSQLAFFVLQAMPNFLFRKHNIVFTTMLSTLQFT